ncbi:unnamed protein product [Urochloa humidicola]
MSSRIAVVLAVAAAAVMVAVAARSSKEPATSDADANADGDALRFPSHPGSSITPSAYRHRRGRHRHPHGPASPTTPPSPPPPPPPAPTPTPLPPACDCRCCNSNDSHVEPDPPFRQPQPGGVGARGSSGTGTGTGWGSRRGPWFGRLPFPGTAPPPPAAGAGTDCVAPLAELMPCGAFVTGSEPATPTPQSDCCTGLGGFFNASTSAAAGYYGDRILRCLCPVILGDVNKMLPKPIDPVRLLYLPIACGVVLPPQVLYICFTGQQTLPPLLDVSSDSDNNSTSTP